MPDRLTRQDSRIVALQESLAVHADLAEPDVGPDGRQAAVAVVVRAGYVPDLLLIRRTEVSGDPWSGHMALPGGVREASDLELSSTAVRETIEETGLDLLRHGVHVGRLPEVKPASRLPRPMMVAPYVFAVLPDTEAGVASPGEVEEVFWVPIAGLLDPGSRATYRTVVWGETRDFPSFLVEGHHVWGMTYRVLQHLLDPLRSSGHF